MVVDDIFSTSLPLAGKTTKMHGVRSTSHNKQHGVHSEIQGITEKVSEQKRD
jgi:hypothetical protein